MVYTFFVAVGLQSLDFKIISLLMMLDTCIFNFYHIRTVLRNTRVTNRLNLLAYLMYRVSLVVINVLIHQ